jgi:hypothetical protein
MQFLALAAGGRLVAREHRCVKRHVPAISLPHPWVLLALAAGARKRMSEGEFTVRSDAPDFSGRGDFNEMRFREQGLDASRELDDH